MTLPALANVTRTRWLAPDAGQSGGGAGGPSALKMLHLRGRMHET
jgi:hypothetical protein